MFSSILQILFKIIRRIHAFINFQNRVFLLKKRYERFIFLQDCAKRNSHLQSVTVNLSRYETLTIGRDVVGNDAFLDTNGPITIGDAVFLGWGVKILTGSHDISKFGVERQFAITPKAVVIEEGVWIASYAIILPGSHIGKHAVVGAGSVVHGYVAPYSVVAGNPAKFIKSITPP